MRLTIIKPDNVVLIDNVAMPVDLAALQPPDTHAIQWQDDYGHIEYDNSNLRPPREGDPPVAWKANELITSVAPWQWVIDEWYRVKAEWDAQQQANAQQAGMR